MNVPFGENYCHRYGFQSSDQIVPQALAKWVILGIDEITMSKSETVLPILSLKLKILVTFVVGLLVSSTLWTNKVYYFDDYYRLVVGNGTFWIYNGRPMTWLINTAIRFSPVFNDISPLPLLLGLAALAAASVIYVEKLALPLQGYWALIPAQFMILNPFITQPMLYTYDSMTILFALALGMFASLPSRLGFIKDISLTTLILIVMLTNYQIGLNVFAGCVLLMALHQAMTQQKVLAFVLRKTVAVILTLLVYKVLVVRLLMTDAYNLERSQMIGIRLESLDNIWNNFIHFYHIVMSAFPGYTALLVIAQLVPTVVGLVILFKTRIKTLNYSRRTWWSNVIGFIALPPIMILAIPGLSLLLTSPVFSPRALPAWGCLSLFCLYVNIKAFQKFKLWISGLYCIPFFYSLVLMISCFNAVVNGQRYTSNVIQLIKSDISHLPPEQRQQIAFIGELPVAPDAKNNIQNFPLIDLIYPWMLKESSSWHYKAIFQRENIHLPFVNTTQEMKDFRPEHYISQDCDYRLFIYEKTAVFDFTDQKCAPSVR